MKPPVDVVVLVNQALADPVLDSQHNSASDCDEGGVVQSTYM